MRAINLVGLVASLFTFLITFTGCVDEVLPDPPPATLSEPAASLSFGRPEGVTTGSTSARALMHTYLEIERAVAGEDWAAADERVRALLLTPNEDAPPHIRQQAAAYFMLDRHLLSAPASPELLEALGYHTDLLIQNRSPQAQQIADALDRLRDHWPEARIQRAAALAAAAAEEHLAQDAACEGCPSTEGTLLEAEAISATARLKSLAQPEERH